MSKKENIKTLYELVDLNKFKRINVNDDITDWVSVLSLFMEQVYGNIENANKYVSSVDKTPLDLFRAVFTKKVKISMKNGYRPIRLYNMISNIIPIANQEYESRFCNKFDYTLPTDLSRIIYEYYNGYNVYVKFNGLKYDYPVGSDPIPLGVEVQYTEIEFNIDFDHPENWLNSGNGSGNTYDANMDYYVTQYASVFGSQIPDLIELPKLKIVIMGGIPLFKPFL